MYSLIKAIESLRFYKPVQCLIEYHLELLQWLQASGKHPYILGTVRRTNRSEKMPSEPIQNGVKDMNREIKH